jgi:hypothetical protein
VDCGIAAGNLQKMVHLNAETYRMIEYVGPPIYHGTEDQQ